MLLIQLVLIVIDRPPFYQFIENFGNMGTHDRFCEMLIIEISIDYRQMWMTTSM
jgi:hypothetical protein